MNLAVIIQFVADLQIHMLGIILKLEEMRNAHVVVDLNLRNVVRNNEYFIIFYIGTKIKNKLGYYWCIC